MSSDVAHPSNLILTLPSLLPPSTCTMGDFGPVIPSMFTPPISPDEPAVQPAAVSRVTTALARLDSDEPIVMSSASNVLPSSATAVILILVREVGVSKNVNVQ